LYRNTATQGLRNRMPKVSRFGQKRPTIRECKPGWQIPESTAKKSKKEAKVAAKCKGPQVHTTKKQGKGKK